MGERVSSRKDGDCVMPDNIAVNGEFTSGIELRERE
jgi:hypothetical protein